MQTRMSGVCLDIHLTKTWCKVSPRMCVGKGLGMGGCHKDGREPSSTGTLQEQDGARRDRAAGSFWEG